MEINDVLDIGREAIYVLLVIAAPAMIVSLIVGLMVALFQALTQIQEMTLTFVPKVLAILLTLIVCMPFMLNTLIEFTHRLDERIAHLD